MSNIGWSDDRIATLSKLWLQGLSASQVARQLGGVTRNAVIGKIHRLGLADRGVVSPPTRAPRVSTARLSRPRRQSAGARRPQPEACATPVKIPAAEAPGLVSNLFHLGANACKWPIGDPKGAEFSFCGAQAVGRYCTGHERLATRPDKTASPIDRDPVVRRALAGRV